MEGSETEQGINPRTLARVFELIRERANAYTYSVEFAILEIYNEEIRDLLVSALQLPRFFRAWGELEAGWRRPGT
eukprot:546900-Rhodomonas_salina.1